ncbi:16S rRNA (cytidine(1402)-2'-O)-methyltransferase [Prosthecobacter sp.]|uniref:16S rRNA (cytidine(1402)-2'-O)-methyltransferase n=1 Tax=Prosthecobacter sp. TaxID=1965333 RepID=UPI003782E3DF
MSSEPDPAAEQSAGQEEEGELFEPVAPAGRLNPGLHLVATPIGNMRDITQRALDTLRAADLVACEDTRHSGMLLKYHDIRARLISLNEHNEAQRIPQLLEHMRQGGSVALISDAGMPTVSDPGQRLAGAVVAAGFHVEGIPGPSAVITALAASGLPTTPFYFGGFLPHKKGARTTVLTAALQRDCTSVFFESPYRLVDTLEILATASPKHRLVVARELTKKFEEIKRGPADILLPYYRTKTPKGEITLLIAPVDPPKWLTW